MTAAVLPLSRLKRACRAAIAAIGGIDGAAASVGKCRSTVGNWNNRNMADLPTLGDAFVLDELALIGGEAPPMVTAMAAELGCAVILLPDCAGDSHQAAALLMQITAELGEVADAMRDALADGRIDGLEPARIEAEVDDLITRAVQLRALMRELQGKAVVGIGGEREARA